jgi:aquaporin Z
LTSARHALAGHWPEYLIEAAALGLFMVSACGFGTLLWHPGSPVAAAVPDGLARRFLMGLAMGGSAVALVYSPWGQRSGAHMNPALTLAFLRLGRVKPWDAAFYAAAQIVGGLAGVLLSAAVLGPALAHPSVRYVVTLPGRSVALAFVAEVAMTFAMMTLVLNVTAGPRARWTGALAGALVCAYITFEAPVSGMSLNPARSLASALPAAELGALWLYFTAPPLGMLAAAELHRGLGRPQACAKYHHENRQRCIFCGKPAG